MEKEKNIWDVDYSPKKDLTDNGWSQQEADLIEKHFAKGGSIADVGIPVKFQDLDMALPENRANVTKATNAAKRVKEYYEQGDNLN